MRLLLLTLCLPLGIGCAQVKQLIAPQNTQMEQVTAQRAVATPSANVFQSDTAMLNATRQNARKNINHYVRGLMQDIAENLEYVNNKTPLAVSSFIYLDGDYNKSSLLGNQIAESFMHELHTFGVPVVDFKTTSFMRVTESGDFVFSRDYLELNPDQNFDYVLAGTMVNQQGGVLVNARIVGLKSKSVVGSAQGFIPQYIVDSLEGSNHNDGIELKQVSE